MIVHHTHRALLWAEAREWSVYLTASCSRAPRSLSQGNPAASKTVLHKPPQRPCSTPFQCLALCCLVREPLWQGHHAIWDIHNSDITRPQCNSAPMHCRLQTQACLICNDLEPGPSEGGMNTPFAPCQCKPQQNMRQLIS